MKMMVMMMVMVVMMMDDDPEKHIGRSSILHNLNHNAISCNSLEHFNKPLELKRI